jgi:predicted nuclease of restriction endonuclease-like RecB superfamily
LLPAPLLLVASSEIGGGQAVPRYLGSHDEVWLRATLDLFDAYVGRTAGERELELPGRVRSLAREHGAPARVADGVAHVLLRRFKTQVDARLEPRQVRAVVFEEAGREDVFERAAALRRAGERLGVSPEEVARALFADRPARRRVVAPDEPLAAAGVVELYNLALVQGLLQRSEQVGVEVREHVRAVVRFAKLSGLLCTCASVASGTRLELSGPLSILRHTTKYGFALASFFPAVVATPGFRMVARCVLAGEPVAVHIGAADRIARTHQLPKDADSAVERALARDVRRLAGEWTLARESDTVALGGSAVFPDFTLRHALGFTVLVEVVGFYTPEYLRSKLVALQAAASRPLLVCIDETLACADGDVPGAVLRFRKRVDARALLALAEELRVGTKEQRNTAPAHR